MKPLALAASAAAALATTSPSIAHVDSYAANLTGAAEAPPTASPGFGATIVTIDLDLVTMRVEALFAGLTGNVIAAHIHCCTSVAGTGTAGVASPVPSFPGFPGGNTFGSYDQTFDLSLASSYNPTYVTNNGGTVSSAMNALLAGVAGGKAYLNIHTTAFSGGEIRGFLQPVPEPQTYAMLLAGLGLLGYMTRRRLSGR